MATFLIALLVGGLDAILAVMIVVGTAHTHRGENLTDLKMKLVSGGVSLYCLNLMSLPLCLVGVGLAVMGLVAHKDRNHLFTWIGLLGNGFVIFGVLALRVLAAMTGD